MGEGEEKKGEKKEVLGHQSVVSTCAICIEDRLDEDKLTRWVEEGEGEEKIFVFNLT